MNEEGSSFQKSLNSDLYIIIVSEHIKVCNPSNGRKEIYEKLNIAKDDCVDLYYDDKCDYLAQYDHNMNVHDVQIV